MAGFIEDGITPEGVLTYKEEDSRRLFTENQALFLRNWPYVWSMVEGEESKIAFNSKYLIDVLGVLKEPKVALETTNPSSPGVIRPLETDNYVHVVMPMFVQW